MNARKGILQLWQFLVYLLEDKKAYSIIQWSDYANFEFKLMDPEEVARLWGLQKNRQTMNYDKLSRSLRYYYEKGIMQKVSGERYVYKFTCCIKNISFETKNNQIRVYEFNTNDTQKAKKIVDSLFSSSNQPTRIKREFHETNDVPKTRQPKKIKYEQPLQYDFDQYYYSHYPNSYHSTPVNNQKFQSQISSTPNYYNTPTNNLKSSYSMSPASSITSNNSLNATDSTPNSLHIHHYHLFQNINNQYAFDYSQFGSNYFPNNTSDYYSQIYANNQSNSTYQYEPISTNQIKHESYLNDSGLY